MSAIVSTVAPVFALILIGYLTTRWGAISQGAAKGLGEFAFVIAMPSLLFRTMVVSPPTTGSPTDILLAFFLSAAVAWVTTTVLAKAWLKRTGLEATALAMGASFGNRRNHCGSFNRFQVFEFFLKSCVTVFGHRNFIHRKNLC